MMISRVYKITIISLVLVLFINCNSPVNNLYSTNKQDVISMIIDEFAKPIPPPPPIGLSKTTLDSLINLSEFKMSHNKKLLVAIYPIMQQVRNISEKDSVYNKEFNFLISKLNKIDSNEYIDIKNIDNKKNHYLFIADTLKLKNFYKKYYDEFDILIQFSNISFNKDFTKAVLVVSKGWSHLAGSSLLCFLEKENGNWIIKKSELLEIS